uniref:cysteinyl leukotriene receptor 2-like n=1 Tax=Centroberyx gerrardi TaxID=166262 RepID=UPI003AAAA392
MMNLALSDAGFSLTLPLRLAYYFRGGVWNFPDWLCRLCVYCFYVNLYTSILFLTLLSVLRWLAVSQPLRHRSMAMPARISLACLAVWVFVGVSSGPFLSNGVTERAGLPRCFEPSSPASWERVLILNYVALALGFLLPFLTIIGCYGSIIRRLTARAGPHGNGLPDNSRRRNNRRRSVRLVSLVTATFLLCFLPYHAVRTLHLHAVCGGWRCGVTLALQRAVAVTLCLAACNSVVNPLLYYYSTRTFRDSMRDAQSSLLSSRGSRTSFRPYRLNIYKTTTNTDRRTDRSSIATEEEEDEEEDEDAPLRTVSFTYVDFYINWHEKVKPNEKKGRSVSSPRPVVSSPSHRSSVARPRPAERAPGHDPSCQDPEPLCRSGLWA